MISYKPFHKKREENPKDTRYRYKLSRLENLDVDYQSGARIKEVPSSQLPPGVLGIYHPSTHSFQVASDISERKKQWVKKHESAHALGLVDEARTDGHATSQTGFNPFNRFYRKAA